MDLNRIWEEAQPVKLLADVRYVFLSASGTMGLFVGCHECGHKRLFLHSVSLPIGAKCPQCGAYHWQVGGA